LFSQFVERWNGRRWSILAGAPIGTSISCPTNRACTEVEVGDGKVFGARWDGNRWFTELAQQTPPYGDSSVSCPSATFCTAVGYDDPGNSYTDPVLPFSFVLRWNESSPKSTGEPGSHATPQSRAR
jgi:hypothetical protein